MFDLDAPIVRVGGPDIPAMPFASAARALLHGARARPDLPPDAGARPVLTGPAGLTSPKHPGQDPNGPFRTSPHASIIRGDVDEPRRPHRQRRPRTGTVRDLVVFAALAVGCSCWASDDGELAGVHDNLEAAIGDEASGALVVIAIVCAGLSVLRSHQAGQESSRRTQAEDRFRAVVEDVPAITYTWDPTKPAGTTSVPYVSPQTRGDPRIHAGGVDLGPDALDRPSASRRSRARARRIRPHRPDRRAVLHGVPDLREGRPRGLAARRVIARGRAGRAAAACAGRDVRHHGAQACGAALQQAENRSGRSSNSCPRSCTSTRRTM